MKLLKHDNKLLTNTNNESQDFGIGNASVVIEILRNRLYKHKIRTLVQEYISNGRDAMREVGCTKPIEVTCPTIFDATFKVRDYGQGITPERMANVFVKYGASTKRDTNNQIGGFGIGAKSAWSYTDSFNIITFIDGVKREYLAHTGVNNNGRLEFLGESETNEANGTAIVIAVNPKDIQQFKSAIERCLFFWPESDYKLTNMLDSVLDNQYESKSIGAIDIYEHLPECIAERYSYSNSVTLSIDGIAYSIKDLVSRIPSLESLTEVINNRIVINIDNGFIEVSANREEVTDSEHTIKQLTKLCDDLLKQVNTEIKSLFKGVTDPKEYLEIYRENCTFYNLRDHNSYKHYKFDAHSLQIHDKGLITVYECFYRGDKFFKKEVKSGSWNGKVIPMDKLNKIYFHDGNLSLVKLGQKLRQNHQDLNSRFFLIESTQGNEEFFKQSIKDLNASDINLVDLPVTPKATKKQRRDSREICMHMYGRRFKETEHWKIKDITDTWHYVKHDEISLRHYEIAKYFGIKICGLSESSIKLIKDNKLFIPLDKVLSKHKLKKSEIEIVMKQKISNHRAISFFDKVKVSDKKLKSYLSIHKKLSNVKYETLPFFVINKAENLTEVKKLKQLKNQFETHLQNNYYLLDELWVNKNNEKDLQIYFNAKQKELNND